MHLLVQLVTESGREDTTTVLLPNFVMLALNATNETARCNRLPDGSTFDPPIEMPPQTALVVVPDSDMPDKPAEYFGEIEPDHIGVLTDSDLIEEDYDGWYKHLDTMYLEHAGRFRPRLA